MFTIFNLLNYVAGKPVNVYVLIALTVGVYFYLIKYHFDTIYDNYIYTIILVILLILDLISIILLFFYDRKDSNSDESIVQIKSSDLTNQIVDTNVNTDNNDKKSKKSRKERKNKDTQPVPEIKKENSYPLDDVNKDMISLFDVNKEPSLHTY